MDRFSLGPEGEKKGAEFLKSRGYRIVARNFRTGFGEIDIIARHGGEIVFIEVKTRSSDVCGQPEESVTGGKMSRLTKASRYYMLRHEKDVSCRFEILSIIKKNEGWSFDIIPVEL